MNDLDRYIESHISPEDPLLRELDRQTHLRTVYSRMISGHQQGRLLEMVVRSFRPRRVLEIGTFTGYSAICMARGLDRDGELHTIEADDELRDFATDYFRRSGLDDRIHLHIGHTLEVILALGVFDMVFIDGDKREYPEYYDLLMERSVHRGSRLVADNTRSY